MIRITARAWSSWMARQEEGLCLGCRPISKRSQPPGVPEMSLHSLPDRIANYGTPLSPSNRTRTAGDLTPTRSSVRLTVTPTWCSWLSVEPLGLSSYLISTGKAGEEVGTLRKSGEQQGGAGAREISNGEISPSFAPSGLAESITFADSNSGPTHSPRASSVSISSLHLHPASSGVCIWTYTRPGG